MSIQHALHDVKKMCFFSKNAKLLETACVLSLFRIEGPCRYFFTVK